MEVTAKFGKVPLLLDKMGLETPLEQVPDAPVAEIEVAGVAAVQQLHSRGEVGLRGFQEEVVVVP